MEDRVTVLAAIDQVEAMLASHRAVTEAMAALSADVAPRPGSWSLRLCSMVERSCCAATAVLPLTRNTLQRSSPGAS